MATFYLLPPRACLDAAVGDLLSRFLPGLPSPAAAWDAILPTLAGKNGWPEDVFLVPRDDLPEGEAVADALTAGFGAEPGDHVVEVPIRPGAPRAWILGAVSGPATVC